MSDLDALKREAARRALDLVRPGMRLGLGTGSTAKHFVDLLGAKVADGFDVLCVPTSEVTRAQASALAIPLTTLDETPQLDMTVDGADEVGPSLSLVKGGGGALLREKIVAVASKTMVVIADATKRVAVLGRFPLPVEVAPFGLAATRLAIEAACRDLGLVGAVTLRRRPDGATFLTDGGHVILDCAFGAIPDPYALARALDPIPGVMGHGLFLGIATSAFIAGETGIETIHRD